MSVLRNHLKMPLLLLYVKQVVFVILECNYPFLSHYILQTIVFRHSWNKYKWLAAFCNFLLADMSEDFYEPEYFSNKFKKGTWWRRHLMKLRWWWNCQCSFWPPGGSINLLFCYCAICFYNFGYACWVAKFEVKTTCYIPSLVNTVSVKEEHTFILLQVVHS